MSTAPGPSVFEQLAGGLGASSPVEGRSRLTIGLDEIECRPPDPAANARKVGPMLDNIPAELLDARQWVVWRAETRNGEPTKVPYQPRRPERRAKTNDPATWGDLATAHSVFWAGDFSGIGFVFSPDDPYCGVDFDGCLDGIEVAEWARLWIDDLDGAYGEVSPSGKGIKLFCKAKLPGPGGKRSIGAGKHAGIEVYDRSRFFVVTGDVTSQVEEIQDCQAAINRLYAWVKEPKTPPPPTNGHTVNGSSFTAAARPGSPDAEARARAYVRTVDPAISGQGGHDRTFYAACKVGPGFDLTPDLAMRIIAEEYNPRCQPPWSQHELEHKIRDAYAKETRRGWLLNVGQHQRASGGNGTARPTAPSSPNGPILKNSGLQASCLHNSKLWLEDPGHGCVIRYDSFTHAVLFNGTPLTDELVIALTGRIEADLRTPWNQEHVRSAAVEIARRNEFSSLTGWLDSLEWDGVGRLNYFFHDAYGCERSEYTIACGRVFFLSAVARAFEPGCQADVMPVLIGPQGIGKSTGMAALAPNPDLFTDDLPDLYDKKPAESLRGKWIVEFAEFTRISRATIDIVKSFLTRRVDRFRPAYGRAAVDYARTCVFIGTTNDPTPLADVENRRFMPITCTQGDVAWIKANRDQLWAEAVDRYRRGEPWWVSDPNLVAEVADQQDLARQHDSWEQILADRLGMRYEVTVAEAAALLDIRPGQIDRAAETRIGKCLRGLGYERQRVMVQGRRSYVYTMP